MIFISYVAIAATLVITELKLPRWFAGSGWARMKRSPARRPERA